MQTEERYLSKSIQENQTVFRRLFHIGVNYDLVERQFDFNERKAVLYYLNGFGKDELIQKIMQFCMESKFDWSLEDADSLLKRHIPFADTRSENRIKQLMLGVFQGNMLLYIDGFEQAFLFDIREYPARGVQEPDKDKTLRGPKDGFVETLVVNTALIRRRIKNENLVIEILQKGKMSQTDIAIVYMADRVDKGMLKIVNEKLNSFEVDALTMNQQSLAECLYEKRCFNPFPKYRYTERPDTASAQIMEGNVVLLVDNSPQAMILPTCLFDILEEADDYYFPPITGTYLRITKMIIGIASFFITPLFLITVLRPELVPAGFSFLKMQDSAYVPVFWQFILLEIALDGLRLAAVNTPSMLSTPLSIMAALILGDYAVGSGWFNSEPLLYMAFVALASYAQTNYELSYAIKFMRILTLVFTQMFGVWGLVLGVGICLYELINNQTLSNKGYLYPLIPFRPKALKRRLLRRRTRAYYAPEK